MYKNHIIDTIGDTPLVKLNNVNKGVKGTILVKAEYFNPGNSVKDRMANKIIEDAEKSGELKPGGTIVEGTSGNTGMGLVLAANAKGYKCVFTLADKQSREKIDILRAMGAEVIVCPTNVPPDDPKSYYSVARKIATETPNAFYVNQYDNLSNTEAHYETTGPETWEQTNGKITHFAAGVGTGGTICGASKYLKEKNADVVSLGIDSYGSVFTKYKATGEFDENEIFPYMVEGIGEDILPENVNFDLIDDFVKVSDKDAAIMTRKLARDEGLFVGWSSGAAVHGALEYAHKHLKDNDLMVIVLPDHGTRYLNKVYNDAWMQDHGFEETKEFSTAKDLIKEKNGEDKLFTIQKSTSIGETIKLLNQKGISQLPVMENEEFVGCVTDTKILHQLIQNPELKSKPVEEVMEDPLQFVSINNSIHDLSSLIDNEHKALLVRDEHNDVHIITQHDVLLALMN